MQALEALFPSKDFTLLAFIVLLPALGALVNGVFGKRLGKEAVTLMGLCVIFVSFLFSVVAFCMLSHAQHEQGGEQAARFAWTGWEWLKLSLPRDSGSVTLNVGFSLDALSATMALVVTGVGFLIHLYSSKYMEEDPGYHRFFCYLNLFIFSMLVLILGDSLPVLFVGWEGVGLCSYLLIGFWFTDGKNAEAGKKAFITNRIGDFGLLVAMGLLLYYTHALDWKGIELGVQNLLTPVQVWPLGPRLYELLAAIFPSNLEPWARALSTPCYVSAATLVGLFLFLGCAGKSAQFPLYVWLPDAMAGPTPVSALIHAATMVTAGVYLVCRMSNVFVLSPAAMFVVAFVGACTALLGAIIAFAQNDIKKVLAYSTVSQLGYMFLGVGVGAFSAGFFHVITHAFFKACLFLGAGSVIHAMHARIHGTDQSQDMRNMGGLWRHMPYTSWTFAVAWAAIVGFPLTSGFFSKDEILLKAYTSSIGSPTANGRISGEAGDMDLFTWPSWGPAFLYTIGLCTAVMTAFYMSRLFLRTFFGEFKGWNIVPNWQAPAHDSHHDAHATDHADHSAHDHGEAHGEHGPEKPLLEGPEPHESPWQMWVPLAILAALAAVAGFLNAHVLGLHAFDHWLEPVFASAQNVKLAEGHEALTPVFIAAAVGAFVFGVGGAYFVYVVKQGEPAAAFVRLFPRLHRLVFEKLRMDELYQAVALDVVEAAADFSVVVDRYVVDGILAGLTGFIVRAFGSVLRMFQAGRVQVYATFVVVGLAGMSWFLLIPQAEAHVQTDTNSGAYTLTAASGLGYSYRWDEDGDAKWDADYSDKKRVSFNLDVDAKRTVRLQVKNAFGLVSQREFALTRPKPDKSGAPSGGAGGRILPVPTPPAGKK